MTSPIVPFGRVKSGVGSTLLKIDHDSLESPIYLTDNNRPITYEGHTYQPYFFKFEAPEENEDTDGSAILTISSVDQGMIDLVRSVGQMNPPVVSLVAVWIENWQSQPVFSKLSGYDFIMAGVDWNAATMSITLGLDTLLNYDIPFDKFNAVNDEGAVQ